MIWLLHLLLGFRPAQAKPSPEIPTGSIFSGSRWLSLSPTRLPIALCMGAKGNDFYGEYLGLGFRGDHLWVSPTGHDVVGVGLDYWRRMDIDFIGIPITWRRWTEPFPNRSFVGLQVEPWASGYGAGPPVGWEQSEYSLRTAVVTGTGREIRPGLMWAWTVGAGPWIHFDTEIPSDSLLGRINFVFNVQLGWER